MASCWRGSRARIGRPARRPAVRLARVARFREPCLWKGEGPGAARDSGLVGGEGRAGPSRAQRSGWSARSRCRRLSPEEPSPSAPGWPLCLHRLRAKRGPLLQPCPAAASAPPDLRRWPVASPPAAGQVSEWPGPGPGPGHSAPRVPGGRAPPAAEDPEARGPQTSPGPGRAGPLAPVEGPRLSRVPGHGPGPRGGPRWWARVRGGREPGAELGLRVAGGIRWSRVPGAGPERRSTTGRGPALGSRADAVLRGGPGAGLESCRSRVPSPCRCSRDPGRACPGRPPAGRGS